MAKTSKVRPVALWTVSALLAALYVFGAGYAKVAGAGPMVENFRAWGHGDGFRVFIGFCEMAGGIGLLIPALASWAAAGLAIIMAGAVYTHVTNDMPVVLPVVLLVMLIAIAYLRRGRAFLLAGRD